MSTVLFTDTIDRIEGSLAAERHQGRPDYLTKKLKRIRHLNQKYSYHFYQEPEVFYKKLSEVTALYPQYPIELSIKGLQNFEGKGSQKRVFSLLVFSAFLSEEWKFIVDIVLERIVSRYFNRKKENLGKIGIETRQLLEVFGRYEIRTRYLQERYSERKLRDIARNGKILFESLSIRFFDGSSIKKQIRRRGYNDHGSLKLAHEYHGELEEVKEENIMEKKDPATILLEIYQESTENYLKWLKSRSEQETVKENSNNNITQLSERNQRE